MPIFNVKSYSNAFRYMSELTVSYWFYNQCKWALVA